MIRKNKIVKKIIISLIIFILIVGIGTCYFIGNQVFINSTQLVTNESTSEVSTNFFNTYGINYDEFKQNYKIEKVELKSSLDGHIIPADYIYSKENKNKNSDTAILVHGLGGNRLTTYPVAEFFLENGYNVITYDQRSSGENTAEYTTFGYYESEDLKDYVKYANEYINNQNLVLWGTSFGGATVGIALGDSYLNEHVDYAILDCPVSDMRYMIKSYMKDLEVGNAIDFMVSLGNIVNRIKLGFGYDDANVCNYTSKTDVPVLIFNSKVDELTPYFMGEDIYKSIKHDNKKIVSVEDSEHANIWLDYNEKYKNEMQDFIKIKYLKDGE